MQEQMQAQHDMMRMVEEDRSKVEGIEGVMETELVCAICSELFIKVGTTIQSTVPYPSSKLNSAISLKGRILYAANFLSRLV